MTSVRVPVTVAEVRAATAGFALEGEFLSARPLVRGHIHDTLVVETGVLDAGGGPAVSSRALVQRMNHTVFRDIPALMHNVATVTRFLGSQDSELDALELVPSADGGHFLELDGDAWRCYLFVDGTTSYDRPRSAGMAHDAAVAFADFQVRLGELDPASLNATIPGFFDSQKRLADLRDACSADPRGRVAGALDEVRFIEERADQMSVMHRALFDGRMPSRVVHGDTKLNNVLFDVETGRPRCIVDLDTCMPGYSLFDFGDLVRFTAATAPEDERDLDLMSVDLELYGAIRDGYLSVAGGLLNGFEREHLGFAARLVTLTLGARFLEDHVRDGGYFKEARPGHNLDRARAQLRLVAELERLLPGV